MSKKAKQGRQEGIKLLNRKTEQVELWKCQSEMDQMVG